VRGIEIILRARDFREAWGFAPNATLIRNLMIDAQNVHDHVMQFYYPHVLNWVGAVSALKADPQRSSRDAGRSRIARPLL